MRQACDRHGTRLENIYTCTTTLAQWTHNTLFSTISVTIFFFFLQQVLKSYDIFLTYATVVGELKVLFILNNSCRRPVLSLSLLTKLVSVNRRRDILPLCLVCEDTLVFRFRLAIPFRPQPPTTPPASAYGNSN